MYPIYRYKIWAGHLNLRACVVNNIYGKENWGYGQNNIQLSLVIEYLLLIQQPLLSLCEDSIARQCCHLPAQIGTLQIQNTQIPVVKLLY